ncbi:MAG: hypothetical protein GF313_14060 [Caldithrix sp.]|nr:hypothetical protein [Caldithrix sp.]
MKHTFNEHILSIALVSVVLLLGTIVLNQDKKQKRPDTPAYVRPYLSLTRVDFSRPFDKALFSDMLDIYNPQQPAQNDSILAALQAYRNQTMDPVSRQALYRETITLPKFFELGGMYVQFIILYVLILVMTYYAVLSLGAYKFIREKQGRASCLYQVYQHIIRQPSMRTAWQWIQHHSKTTLLLLQAAAKGMAYLFLFSPAYVIAYSIKTRIDTDSVLFMIVLGVLSNGLLITYTRRFYTFLKHEARKGYVETARVKGLQDDYQQIGWRQIVALRKRFRGHVFDTIYQNAHFQYLTTIKEQASFLVTGLIIIEMALNVHGHLTYEMLQQLLYKNYAIVLLIFLGIFYLIKGTEIYVDWLNYRESRRYENI